MFKSLIVTALIGPLGMQSLSDELKSSTALPLEAMPALVESAPYGQEGADLGIDPATNSPWDGAGARLFEIGHRYGYEGGEGGEGGEGYHYEGGEGGEGGEGHAHYLVYPTHLPKHAGLAPIIGPCDRGKVIGTLAGAATGGFLGSRIGDGDKRLVAVGAGVFIGAILGHEIGAALDAGDLACAEHAVQRAHTIPVGQQIAWNNPQTGRSGTVTPVREGTYQATGQYCREYQTTVKIGGREERAYGIACRQPDGSWQTGS